MKRSFSPDGPPKSARELEIALRQCVCILQKVLDTKPMQKRILDFRRSHPTLSAYTIEGLPPSDEEIREVIGAGNDALGVKKLP